VGSPLIGLLSAGDNPPSSLCGLSPGCFPRGNNVVLSPLKNAGYFSKNPRDFLYKKGGPP